MDMDIVFLASIRTHATSTVHIHIVNYALNMCTHELLVFINIHINKMPFVCIKNNNKRNLFAVLHNLITTKAQAVNGWNVKIETQETTELEE